MPDKKPRWFVTCSCGWERGASSLWVATAIFRLHARHLGEPGTEHTIAIEGPPADAPPGTQFPLIQRGTLVVGVLSFVSLAPGP